MFQPTRQLQPPRMFEQTHASFKVILDYTDPVLQDRYWTEKRTWEECSVFVVSEASTLSVPGAAFVVHWAPR